MLELMDVSWFGRKMVSFFYNPKKQGWYTEIKMINETTANIKNTDFKGSFMSEFEIKNGEKTFYKVKTGIKSHVDCETECKWTISELTPNQLTVPFTTKMGPKTFQGERKILDDSMIETSYISGKPTVVTYKRVN